MLNPGAKLGPYEVVTPLGSGGMGEVYRARDSKLGREVALKVLPEAFAHDPDRMARFEREAKVLASLNHPGIAGIHGLEDSGATRALVMELVDGPTLADRIRSGPIPADEALPIARQICEALEFAHDRGIVHRDLKPANIKVTSDDAVKLLDFGLAKALESEATPEQLSNSPTLTAATQAGVLLGTAAYMSPEQARGKPADRRADSWAFGCVLFEMLSGKKAFGGETVSDTLASVIKESADLSALPAGISVRIRVLIQRCLQKDPRQRLQAIGDARIAIEEVLSGAPDPVADALAPAPSAAVSVPRPGPLHFLPWALAGVLAAGLLVALFALNAARQHPTLQPAELNLLIPPGQQLDTEGGLALALSPDGSRIAYVTRASSTAGAKLYVREMDKATAIPLDGTTGASNPFFSPDGQWIGFFADNKVKKVSVRGGAPITLCDSNANRGAAWGEDGYIYFPREFTSPLSRVSAAGGAPELVTHLDSGRNQVTHRWPQLLPSGRAILFTASADNNNFEHSTIEVAPLDSGKPELLVANAAFGRYLPGGYLAYVSQGTLFVAPFDPDERKLAGTASPVLSGVFFDLTDGAAQVNFSSNGTVLYLSGNTQNENLNLVWMDRKGKATILLKDQSDCASPRLSPDGKRLLYQKETGSIWIYDMVRGTAAPLTLGPGGGTFPVWSADGQRIAYSHPYSSGTASGQRIYWRPANGTGDEEPLTPGRTLGQYPSSWSPDGNLLVFYELSEKNGACCEIWDVETRPGAPPADPKPLVGQSVGKPFVNGIVSPDGRWLAYQSDESGSTQIYVAPFPGPGGRWQISTAGGIEPRWSKSSHELFYLAGPDLLSLNKPQLVAVPYYVEQNTFEPGRPVVLFEGDFLTRIPYSSYDVASDGQHFVMFQDAGNNTQSVAVQPTVLLNWLDQMRRLVASSQGSAAK
jgi:eukaryotic-like serine/threonine-protein kinase